MPSARRVGGTRAQGFRGFWGLGLWGLGFRVWGLGFGGFRVLGVSG